MDQDQINSQDNLDATETLSEEQLDEMEQSDRLGGVGTMLGADESIHQVDATDQHELEQRSTGQSDTDESEN